MMEGLSAILSPADRPPHPNLLPACGEKESGNGEHDD